MLVSQEAQQDLPEVQEVEIAQWEALCKPYPHRQVEDRITLKRHFLQQKEQADEIKQLLYSSK